MRLLIAGYITSSLLLLSVEYFRIWSKSEDLRLSIFTNSRCVTHSSAQISRPVISLDSEHPYSLNGRLVYIVLAQMWLSISFALRNIVLERSVFRWAKAQLPSNAVGPLWFKSLFTPRDTKHSLLCREIAPRLYSPSHFSRFHHLQSIILCSGWRD